MWPFFLSFTISALTAPLVIWFYKKNNWLDNPKKDMHVKKTHSKPVPRGGGLVIFTAFLISSLLLLQVDKYLVAIIISAALLTLVGFFDDVFDISPKIRLVTGLIAAGIVVASGIGIAYITNPFAAGVIHLNQPQIAFELFGKVRTIWILADIFALLFILWNMNSVNWSKGVDGQLPSFVTVGMIVIGIFSSRFVDDPTLFHTTTFSFIVAGAFAGLLLWNWYPQKMMPGYGAGSLAGFFLGVTAIISGAKVATILLVLGIPTADAVFTILRRIIERKSPLWGDRGHLHHILLDHYNFTPKYISIFYLVSSMLLGGIALYLNTTQKLITMTVIFVFVFGAHITTRQSKRSKR